MIKTYLITKDGVREDVPCEDWKSLTKDDCALLWVDVRSAATDEIRRLADIFGLHSLAIKSVQDGYQRPHLHEFPDHFYVNMTTVRTTNRGDHAVKPSELHLFAGEKWIITIVREQASDAVDKALAEFRQTPSLCARGPFYAVYLLAEDLVETYYPIVEKLDEEADKIEDIMLDGADKKSLKRLFDLKRQAFDLRRILGPQRDIFNELARRDFPFMDGENQVYFQDVYNRMIRLFDMLDTVREILSGGMDIYLSSVSNRLNEVMKVLTVFATILMTLSFITGFYGMNFTSLPWLQAPNAARNIAILMGVITVGLLWWFKRKGWL